MKFLESFRIDIRALNANKVRSALTMLGVIIGVAAIIALIGLLGFFSVWWLVFVVGVLVAIFLHELGHFVTARRTGMKATQFFIGFGPRVWSFRKGETEYGVKAIPAGGFVKIVGMTSLEEVDAADAHAPDGVAMVRVAEDNTVLLSIRRADLIRLASAASLTTRPSHSFSNSSSLDTMRSRCSAR